MDKQIVYVVVKKTTSHPVLKSIVAAGLTFIFTDLIKKNMRLEAENVKLRKENAELKEGD